MQTKMLPSGSSVTGQNPRRVPLTEWHSCPALCKSTPIPKSRWGRRNFAKFSNFAGGVYARHGSAPSGGGAIPATPLVSQHQGSHQHSHRLAMPALASLLNAASRVACPGLQRFAIRPPGAYACRLTLTEDNTVESTKCQHQAGEPALLLAGKDGDSGWQNRFSEEGVIGRFGGGLGQAALSSRRGRSHASAGRAGCPQPAAVEAHDSSAKGCLLNDAEFCKPLY